MSKITQTGIADEEYESQSRIVSTLSHVSRCPSRCSQRLQIPPVSPVHLLLLPTRQLHGDTQLLVETRRHAEVSRQLRVGHCAVGERGVGGGLQRGDGGGLAGVSRVLSLSAGQ